MHENDILMHKNDIFMHENDIFMHENDTFMHENDIIMHENQYFLQKFSCIKMCTAQYPINISVEKRSVQWQFYFIFMHGMFMHRFFHACNFS